MVALRATNSWTRKRAGGQIASLVALGCCLALFGCGGPSPWPDATRTVPPTVPLYPNIQPDTQSESPAPRNGRITTFLTSDTNEVVQDFYNTELRRTGWTRDVGDDTSTFVRFANREACPVYTLSVQTVRLDPQTLKVSVEVGPEECRRG